jgi:hypothetical protein
MAADGARYAAVNTNPGANQTPQISLKEWIADQASNELKNGSASVTTPVAVTIWTNGNIGDPVRVCVKATYTPVRLFNLGPDLTFHGDATMRLEQKATTDIKGIQKDGDYVTECPS